MPNGWDEYADMINMTKNIGPKSGMSGGRNKQKRRNVLTFLEVEVLESCSCILNPYYLPYTPTSENTCANFLNIGWAGFNE